jgi:transcriptional regulator NrdR family protein
MRKLLNGKIVEQRKKCATCHEEFTDYNDTVPRPQGTERNGWCLAVV